MHRRTRAQITLGYCPTCNLRYSRMAHTGDMIHDCSHSPSATLGNEDILVVHTSFTDFDGSGGKGPTEVMMQGVENKLFGTLAFVLGADNESRTGRGNPVNRYRTRKRLTYIEH